MDLSQVCSRQGVSAAQQTLRESKPAGYYAHQEGLAAKAAAPRVIVPDTLAQCIAVCIQSGWDDVFGSLQAKIVADVNRVPTTEFRPLWLPCLRKIIHTLEANNVPLSTPAYQELSRAILEAYVNRYIGPEPSGAIDHRQKPVSCSCSDCPGLNAFLRGPQKVGRFPMAERRRRHLESKLTYSGSGCTMHTESWGSPYTLVVTKGLDSGTRALQEWTRRRLEGQQDLAEFDRENMDILLGEETWHRITGMQHLSYTGQSRDVEPAASVPAASVPAASARTVPVTQPSWSRPPLGGLGSANVVRPPVANRAPSGTLAGRKRGRGDVDDPIVLD